MGSTGLTSAILQPFSYFGLLPGSPVWQHTFVSPSAFSRRAVVSYWRKYVHEVLVNRLGGLSLPRKSVVRLTDRPDMTLDVYRGRKTTIQQQQLPWKSSFQNMVFSNGNFCSSRSKFFPFSSILKGK